MMAAQPRARHASCNHDCARCRCAASLPRPCPQVAPVLVVSSRARWSVVLSFCRSVVARRRLPALPPAAASGVTGLRAAAERGASRGRANCCG